MRKGNVQNVFKNQDKEKRKSDFNKRLSEAINRAEKYRLFKKV